MVSPRRWKFATSHPESVNALFTQAHKHNLRLITGKGVAGQALARWGARRNQQSLIDTDALIQRWHVQGRLGYAITPRFAPTSTEVQLRGAGELAARYPDVWIQSHVAENKDQIAWVHDLFPSPAAICLCTTILAC